jgi:hypothetical protein
MTPDNSVFQLNSCLADATIITSDEAKMAILNLLRGRNSVLSVMNLLVERANHLSATESSKVAADYIRDIHEGLSELAAREPVTHPHVVDLIEALHKRPEEVIRQGFGTFAMQHGDFHRYLESSEHLPDKYININSFEARLWSRLGPEFGRDALSDPIEKLSRSVEAELPDNRWPQTNDAKISAGCMWMLHAGPTIWKFSREEYKEDWGNQFKGVLWKDGNDGYSMARWDLWLERFDAIAKGDGPDVTVETRGHASASARVMRELQKARDV